LKLIRVVVFTVFIALGILVSVVVLECLLLLSPLQHRVE
jgi:hypothetical protein